MVMLDILLSDEYLQTPALGNNAATIGCLAMAKALLK